MRMWVNICCCLVTLALGCDVAAGIQQKIIRNKASIVLSCPLSVEGNVTWSRENKGRKFVILTADCKTFMRHINDTRFTLSADQSLIIQRPTPSDSGRYLCNNEPAVQLTVFPSEIQHQVIRNKASIVLSCPLSVKGNVTWSRENKGRKFVILTADCKTFMRHINDTRFTSLPDQSLFILRPTPSDSGRYLCNNEPAVQLTVFPSEIQQKIIRNQASIVLSCPLSVKGNVTWSRENKGRKFVILTADCKTFMRHINDTRFTSLPDQSLFILRPTPSDSGRYLCNNEPAVQLTVFPSALRKAQASTDKQLHFGLMSGITATLFIISIITVLSAGRCRSTKQGNEKKGHTCHHTVDVSRSEPANCEKQEVLRETLPGNEEEDHVYHYIVDGLQSSKDNRNAHSSAAYSLASFPGPSQGTHSSYSLQQIPKAKRNDGNHFPQLKLEC
ncbi:uncharacterized protein LOC115788551 [Archocentrus centrarchus]|uniref:uncharacterized protein LOC115788551 n=1 Tax=Archocentrus centrarchus TaxID=63155 RepID=UPI0011EA0582|nr:uncharacterized protein LOC115788551 [Archocentrus centrarchus]